MGFTRFFRSGATEGSAECQVEFIEPNLNLLAHAQTLELEIGSRCGGHGKCGGDRIRVLPDSLGRLSELTEPEKRLLSTDEIEKGYRLACQCFPNDAEGDLKVEIFPSLTR